MFHVKQYSSNVIQNVSCETLKGVKYGKRDGTDYNSRTKGKRCGL